MLKVMTHELIGQLATFALVGTGRKSPVWPVLPAAIGELITSLNSQDATAKLLQTAGILALTESLAIAPYVVAPTAVVTPAPEETMLVLNSPRLHGIISELLQNGPVEILVELLNLFTVHKLLFPSIHLPSLLNMAIAKPLLRDVVASLPGNRQQWLMELNPNWQGLKLTSPSEVALTVHSASTVSATEVRSVDTLDDRTLKEQIAILKHLRIVDPERGRQALTALLPQANALARQELLAVLQQGLALEDATLLNQALGDRSKGVRQIASQMLSCLPASAFAQRMVARLETMVSSKKPQPNSKLLIEVPEQIDTAWQQDGIDTQPPPGEGAKAFVLRQLTGLTPLAWWENKFSSTPAKIVELCAKSDWHAPLLAGFCTATVTQSNAAWATALLELKGTQNRAINTAALLKIAHPEAAEAILMHDIKTSSKLSEWLAAIQLAANLPKWSVNFGNDIVASLKEHPEQANIYASQLNFIALLLPVKCLMQATTGWGDKANKPTINTFINYIQLRYSIYQELKLLQ